MPIKSSSRLTGQAGGLAIRAQDGLVNVMSGMGGSGDKNTYARWSLGDRRGFANGIIDRQQVAAAYMTNWLVAKIHDIPPEEMTKSWRDWQAAPDEIKIIEAEEKRLGLKAKVQSSLREGLFGGGALIMGLPGRADTPAPPPEALSPGDLRYLFPVSRDQLGTPDFDRDLESDGFGGPTSFVLAGTNMQAIHRSRVLVFSGKPTPRAAHMSWQDVFWGRPLMERINSAMQNAELAQTGVATLLHELKTDIISIPELTELVSTAGGEEALSKRLAVAAAMASMFNVKLLDGGPPGEEHGGETWETRQISFAQLPDVVTTFIQIGAGAADIPLTRILGTSAKGLNATGEGDENNFLSMIGARQNSDLRPNLERLDPYLKASAGVKSGDDLTWTFGALRKMTPKEEAEIDKIHADAFKALSETGAVPPDALSTMIRNKLSERETYPGIEDAFDNAEEEIPDVADKRLAEEGMVAANENESRKIDIVAKGSAASGRVRARDSLKDSAARALYVSRQVMNPQEILNHFRKQGVENLQSAASLHVTITFSRRPVDWMAMGSSWNNDAQGRLRIAPGGPRVLELFGPQQNVLVQSFQSDELQWRHESMMAAGASWDWDEYAPHITISKGEVGSFDVSKLQPYTGRIVLGPERFESLEV